MVKIVAYLKRHWSGWTSLSTLLNLEVGAPNDVLQLLVGMVDDGTLFATDEFGTLLFSMCRPPNFVVTLNGKEITRRGVAGVKAIGRA